MTPQYEIMSIAPIIVSILTTLITIFIAPKIKDFFDIKFHRYKIETDYEIEQRKKIKDALSKNKILLLNSCEDINARLFNLAKWGKMEGSSIEKDDYYLWSFVYRIGVVLAWIKTVEQNMLYLDTTTSISDDLDFIKYLRTIPQTLSFIELRDNSLVNDPCTSNEYILKGDLDKVAESFIEAGKVISYASFEKLVKSDPTSCHSFLPLYTFLKGISSQNHDLRWDRLQIFHLTIIGILNSFGFDFQNTSSDQIKKIFSYSRKSRLINIYVELIKLNCLAVQKKMKLIIQIST